MVSRVSNLLEANLNHMDSQPEDPVWRGMIETGLLNGRAVQFLASTTSTNQVALELGRQGVPNGTVILAETQTQGRGRLGKEWVSPPGSGLYFSQILRPQLDLPDLPKITLAAGLAVCQAVEETTELRPLIKWPNDLLLAGRKFCGILTESALLEAGAVPLAVLGIGLNVSTPRKRFPEDLRAKATSLLAQSGQYCQRGPLLAAILTRLEVAVRRLEDGDFEGILEEWRRRDALVGKHLTWVTPARKVVAGVALGPDAQGVLHLRDREGTIHEVLSGDLQLAER